MEIFISKSGQRYGPYTLDQVNALLASRQIKPSMLAWHQGMNDWTKLAAIPGVRGPNIAREQRICLIAGILMGFIGSVWCAVLWIKNGNPFGFYNPQGIAMGFAASLFIGGFFFSLIYGVKLLRRRRS
jgi:hypothetical protein